MDGEQPAQEQPPAATVVEEDDDDDDEDNIEKIPQETLDANLLEAVRDNKTEACIEALEAGGNPVYEKDGWNPLLWAACNGNEEIVRVLIKRDACNPYIKDNDNQVEKNGEQEDDAFRKPEDAKKIGKYTPLHWASYKGWSKIVWILLKVGMSPLKIDQYGNTAVHQACAAGNLEILKVFLARGVNVNKYNGRIHTPNDLATEGETRQLLKQAKDTKYCQNPNCKSKFDFLNTQFFCQESRKFFCKKCSATSWVFEEWDSTDMERPLCRSHPIVAKIKKHEDELQAACDGGDYGKLDKTLEECKGIDISAKLRHDAEVQHLKLQHQLKINKFLGEKHHHDDYKDIRKDVKLINDMVEKARELEIDLDQNMIEEVNNFTSRLISERNLRKQRDLYIEGISSSDAGMVDKLQGLIDVATDHAVEDEYMVKATKLTSQMRGNIKARETLQMLLEYPIRIYPEPEEVDPKKKDKKAPPKKKKKKKDDFDTPTWAEELNDVIKKVAEMKDLAQDKVNLKLADGFVSQVDEQLSRFKKEIGYRRQVEQEAREAEEARLAAKNKKKKK